MLPCCRVAGLPCCRVAVLLCCRVMLCSPVAVLSCCRVAVIQCCCAAILPCCCAAVLPCCDAVVPVAPVASCPSVLTSLLFVSAIMVFHGTGFPGSKRTKIGRPVCRANSNTAREARQEAAEIPEPAVAAVDPPPPPPKKQRADNNWRVTRAVRSRDKTLERRAPETANLSQNIDSL